jgi:alkaline phosphatase D
MDRRDFIAAAIGLPAIACGRGPLAETQRPSNKLLDPSSPISRIAFGSCAEQNRPQPIWDPILQARPELFLLIGDNIYADTEDMLEMRRKYEMLGAKPGFKKLRESVPLLATWDDHDFGTDDGGADYPKKEESRQVFFEFFNEPPGSPRRTHEGVYDSRIIGPEGKRVQVVLLDTRYNRTKLTRRRSSDPGRGKYAPDTDPSATFLGAGQWRWLEQQLRKTAEVRLIASSIQVVAEDHGWEKWMNMPAERKRLFDLIGSTNAKGVFFISGDRHFAELSMIDAAIGYPLYDLTSSGLTKGSRWRRPDDTNRHRVAAMDGGDNFGFIEIDWSRPQISLQARDEQGSITLRHTIDVST